LSGIDGGLVGYLGWHGAGSGKNDHVGGEIRLLSLVLGESVQVILRDLVGDADVGLALEVPLLPSGAGLPVGDHVPVSGAGATVPFYCVELAAAFDELVYQALKVVGGEILKFVLMLSGKEILWPDQLSPPPMSAKGQKRRCTRSAYHKYSSSWLGSQKAKPALALQETVVSFTIEIAGAVRGGRCKMRVRWYGWVGLATILGAEICLYARQPFVSQWFTPVVWTGYVLLVDALVLRLRGHSLINDRPREALMMAWVSVGCWLLFEAYNLRLRNWYYVGVPEHPVERNWAFLWSFATMALWDFAGKGHI